MAATSPGNDNAKTRAREAARHTIRDAQDWTPRELAQAVLEGRRDALAQAITWVESSLPQHQGRIEALLAQLPPVSDSLRVGFTGIPGAGKSTLIERFGLNAVQQGWRVAVLAVDPSSQRTSGSLLGDKTRMTELSKHPHAFVRPSAAATTLGGVSRATSEAIQLCEAAGYNLILVETVGVGQSEVSVRSMVDLFALLLIGGAGDDVQGIKRGVVEMADLVVVHKAEEDKMSECRDTASAYRQALHVLPSPPSGETPDVLLVSSLTGAGHDTLWTRILQLREAWMASGWWEKQRALQRVDAMHRHARQLLIESHMHHKVAEWSALESDVVQGKRSPFSAARTWVDLPQSPPA